MPGATIDDIWIFIYERGEVRTRDLEKHFVSTKRMSRGTMYKYKRQLEFDSKICAKPVHSRPPYNVYYVPEKYHRECEALKQYKQLPFKYINLQIPQIKWQDAPKGFYLTDVKEKILWENKKTGAIFLLGKAPIGLTDTPHIHPEANMLSYCLSGEIELPNGTISKMAGHSGYQPKGTLDVGYKIVKEALILVYWDGPRTKIEVDVPQDT